MKKKILIVDDEVAFTRTLKLNLERTGNYEVCVENIPEETVKTAKNFKPDLIILDVIMPMMFGGDVAAKLRAEPDLQDVPIIFLTAYVKRHCIEEHEGYISGYPFLAKPATLEEIIAAIEKHIKKN
ncbi:MAG: response regulator [Verrucomicrobiia bacterium]